VTTAPQDAVLELVVYKLKDGVNDEGFLRANDVASRWMEIQPGFVGHELFHDAEGERWIELVRWETLAEAHGAAERAMSSESCAPLFALIDLETALMVHGEPAIAPVYAERRTK
jgi:hypothetical protein